MSRSGLRLSVGVGCAALAFAVVGQLARVAVDATGADAGIPTIDLAIELRGKLANISALREKSDDPIVVVIGDSTVLNDYLRPEVRKDVGRALARRLADLEPRPRVRTIASPGLSPASSFWLAPDVISTRPAAVLLAANLAVLSDWWQYGIPELVRWYPNEDWWRPLFLPIHADGLSADRYLLRWLGSKAVPLQAERSFAHARARVRRSRVALENRWLGARAAELPLMSKRQNRRIHFQGEDRYAGALRGVASDHAQLGMLRALVAEFERNRIPEIVYVPPVSPAYFRDPMNLDTRFARSLDAIRGAAGSADFLDLHDALPETAFRDWQDHYTTDGNDSGMDQLAALLEGPVRQALGHAGSD